MDNYTQHVTNAKSTPKSEPIPGREADMAKNEAGGFVFVLDDWKQLDRFLILGAEGPTYYASEKTAVKDNVACVERCVAADGVRVVNRLVEVSEAGRAPKNDPAILVLAFAMKRGNDETRRAARAAIPKVCRIGTHLFHLASAMEAIGGGWGTPTQKAFAQWYLGREPNPLAYDLIKYQSRDGWAHSDILRLAKPKGHERGGDHDRLLRWVAKGWQGDLPAEAPTDATRIVWAFEAAKRATSKTDIVRLITDHGLPREGIPTEHLNEVEVWDALLDNQGRGMPITALVRNLAKMTAIGFIKPMSAASRRVTELITDAERIRKGRIHPLALLVALKTYAQGRGEKGSLTWAPDTKVVDALNDAFYLAFQSVTPTGKRWVLGLDVSGSMHSGTIAGMPGISPAVATGAMALVTANVEPEHAFVAFSHQLVPITISPRARLDHVVADLSRIPMGGTDCTLPIRWAMQHRIPVDVFAIFTDGQDWHGHQGHVVQVLRDYRQVMGIPTRLVSVGMLANRWSVADPKDPGMLDVVGFDTAAPEIMGQFALGNV